MHFSRHVSQKELWQKGLHGAAKSNGYDLDIMQIWGNQVCWLYVYAGVPRARHDDCLNHHHVVLTLVSLASDLCEESKVSSNFDLKKQQKEFAKRTTREKRSN